MSGSPSPRIVLATPDDAAPLVQAFDAWADEAERTRHGRLAREVDRLGYTAAHALLRRELAREMQVPPERLRFAYEANGKPFLVGGGATPSFSLSHSGGHALVAISRSGAVGVDLELGGLAQVSPALIDRIAAPEEAGRLPTHAAALERALLRLWVVKEAATKMTGEGLSCAPHRLLVEPTAADHALVRDLRHSGAPPIALARLIELAGGAPAAIAVPLEHGDALPSVAIQPTRPIEAFRSSVA